MLFCLTVTSSCIEASFQNNKQVLWCPPISLPRRSHLRPLGAPSSWTLSLVTQPASSLITSWLSGRTKCSGLILYFSFPSPGIHHLSEEPWVPSTRSTIGSPQPGTPLHLPWRWGIRGLVKSSQTHLRPRTKIREIFMLCTPGLRWRSGSTWTWIQAPAPLLYVRVTLGT